MSPLDGRPPRPLPPEIRASVAAEVAQRGVAAVLADRTRPLAGLSPSTIHERFGSVDRLVHLTAETIAAEPVVRPAAEPGSAPDVAAELDALLTELRDHVDADPVRHAFLLQLASAALTRHRQFASVLTERTRRTKATVRGRLTRLRLDAQLTLATSDIATIADALVDSANGVELSHLVDRDEAIRVASYAALADALAERLSPARVARRRPPSVDQLTFRSDFRVRVLVDDTDHVRDVLEVSGIGSWDSRVALDQPLARLIAGAGATAEHAQAWMDRLRRARLDPLPASYADARPDGPRHGPAQVFSTITPVPGPGGQLTWLLLDVEDRTAAIAAEQQRREIDNQYRSAMELTRLGSYVAYIREPRIDTDERFREIYGLDPQHLMETEGFDGFFDVMHREDAPRVRQALEDAMTGEVDYIASYRLWAKRPDGPELRWIEALGRVESDEDGPLRVIGVVEDVTERRRSQDSLLRKQKREAVGSLAAGIAHDFNNVLGAILANASLASSEVARAADPSTSLQEIERGARRAGELVQRLLAFSRDEEPRREPVDLGEVALEVCSLLRPTLGADVRLEQRIAPDLPAAVGDATQLHQVLINLIVNADHAIDGKPGVISVTVDAHRRTQSAGPEPESLPAGDYLRLQVRDDGPGVPQRVAERIFDPFFTTTPNRGSTGLGLSSSQAIVEAHGGSIRLEAAPGGGALFTVLLPARPEVRAEVPVAPDIAWRAQVETGLARILFVDDEAALTEVAARGLPESGCTTVAFSDPGEALEAFRCDPDAFDAIITDLAMPTMSGLDLIREVRELRPSVPVVLTSGHLTPGAEEEARRQHVGYVIPKPWTIDELAARTLELIGQR